MQKQAAKSRAPPDLHLMCKEGSHYQTHNDTIHSDCVSAIPFGLCQDPGAADGYLIGRVNQELMHEELGCSCFLVWTVYNVFPLAMFHVEDAIKLHRICDDALGAGWTLTESRVFLSRLQGLSMFYLFTSFKCKEVMLIERVCLFIFLFISSHLFLILSTRRL